MCSRPKHLRYRYSESSICIFFCCSSFLCIKSWFLLLASQSLTWVDVASGSGLDWGSYEEGGGQNGTAIDWQIFWFLFTRPNSFGDNGARWTSAPHRKETLITKKRIMSSILPRRLIMTLYDMPIDCTVVRNTFRFKRSISWSFVLSRSSAFFSTNCIFCIWLSARYNCLVSMPIKSPSEIAKKQN